MAPPDEVIVECFCGGCISETYLSDEVHDSTEYLSIIYSANSMEKRN